MIFSSNLLSASGRECAIVQADVPRVWRHDVNNLVALSDGDMMFSSCKKERTTRSLIMVGNRLWKTRQVVLAVRKFASSDCPLAALAAHVLTSRNPSIAVQIQL